MYTFTVATKDVFETLAESLEEGEPLPAEVLITYLQHPEEAIQELAAKLLHGRPDREDKALEHSRLLAEDSEPTLRRSAQQMKSLLQVADRRIDRLTYCEG